ncbi:hypothetical protein HaLaN_06150 [Haematococcus lacustris]|uniref:Uncharacterized protein n=1 Tax=Haematococcus lacustris TaxID=44745 RepID=A0A699YVD4_HAELA|nr:hypothetical protein HaLaN_06150 [Haematococcus lacustris]
MACGALRACLFSANFAMDATERLATLLFCLGGFDITQAGTNPTCRTHLSNVMSHTALVGLLFNVKLCVSHLVVANIRCSSRRGCVRAATLTVAAPADTPRARRLTHHICQFLSVALTSPCVGKGVVK